MERECTNCLITKPLNFFHTRKGGLYDKHAQCADCLRKKNRIYRQNNLEKIRIKDAIYRSKNKEKYIPFYRIRYQRLEEKSLLGFKRFADRKMHSLAANIVNYGVRIGILIKDEKCHYCSCNEDIQGHHMDYSKPTEVIWLCRACHAKVHRKKE